MLLTFTEAAKRLGVSYYAVKNAVSAGRISTVVLSKKQLIPETELEKLLKIDHSNKKPAKANIELKKEDTELLSKRLHMILSNNPILREYLSEGRVNND